MKLHKWKMLDTPLCECGQVQPIETHGQTYTLTKNEEETKGLHKGDSETQDR